MINKFIVIEGLDGAGKSEVSKKVASALGITHLESPIDPFKEIRESRKEKYLWDLFQKFSILILVFLLIYLTFRFLKYIIIKFKEIDFSISININKKSKEG